MDWIIIGQTVASLMGTLSIWEGMRYWLNRKTNRRKEKAEADMAEFNVQREMLLFTQAQLKASEERYDDQTQRLRRTQDDNVRLMRENSLLRLSLSRNGIECINESNNEEN